MPAWIEVALVASQLDRTVSAQKPTSVAKCTVPGLGIRKLGQPGGNREVADTTGLWYEMLTLEEFEGVMIPEEWLVMGDGDGGKATEINRWKSLAALEGLSPFQIEIIEG